MTALHAKNAGTSGKPEEGHWRNGLFAVARGRMDRDQQFLNGRTTDLPVG
ncbi:MAG: hypothetical protein GWP04_02960 [Gammaproteobacteria bacterium]|nr:hypothetical protein [Gammaproteobacteria bacterium]